MALTKDDEKKVEQIVEKKIREMTQKVGNDKYKETESRLRAYPVLQRNIAEYKLDIEDVLHEDMRRSKDIIFYTTGGIKAEIEEIREAKIIKIKKDIARDEMEVLKIERALKEIESDRYYKIVEMLYFAEATREEIAAALKCDAKTISRNRNRLVNRIAVKLYGADALGK